MLKNLKIGLLILSGLFVCQYNNAQSPFFKPVSLLKSRQAISVSSIFQESKGFLWISTSSGLIRYDGLESYIFGLRDSLNPSPVTAICEDSIGQIWVGHKNGLIDFFSDGLFNRFKPEEGLSHSEISFIKFDSKGTLWFGTLGEGIYYYKGKYRKRINNINKDDGLNDDYVYTLAETGSGEILIGTDNGINVINQNTDKITGVISMRNGLPDNIVKHLEVSGNRLWIGMDEKGLCTFDLGNHRFEHLLTWDYGTLNIFSLRTADECWASTKENGVIKFELKDNKLLSIKQYSSQNGLPDNATTYVYSDRERNIWIGYPGGLILSSSSACEFINKKSEGFDYGNVFSFVADSKNRYWAATQQGLICLKHTENGKLKSTKVLSDIREVQNAMISVYVDKQGYVWAGTYGYGVFRINPENNTFKKYDNSNGLPDNNILHITGTDDQIWFATAGGGAASLNLINKDFKIYNISNGLGSNYLYSTFIDSKTNIWFALDGKGVSVLQNGKMTTSFLPDSLAVNTVYAIAEDKLANLWFLTSDKGLLRFNGKSYKFFNETNGLKTNNIRSIVSDMSGNIVISSNEGLQIFDSDAGGFESFGEERGVAYLEPNINGISIDHSGIIWISENEGIIKYNPASLCRKEVLPIISLTRKLLFFNSFEKNKNKFRFNQNHLTFEYTGFWFQSTENLVYRYQLENYDYDWSIPTHARSVTYSNLPPGNYTFKVEVSHKPGMWIESNDAEFSFRIKPPFYRTWWFILISVLFVLASIYYYIKARTAKLLRAKEELEQEVIKRTRTIVQQKEEIETQRDEIEAQRDFVTKQRDQIALQNEHITSGIQYASRIQQAMLTPLEDFDLYLKNYFILNRPMDIVSGDFYWLASKNKRIFVVVADCTGHGVSGAFMSVLGISLLHKIVNFNPQITASQVLDQLRDEVKYALKQTGRYGEAQDGMDISLIILEENRKSYQFAGANNAVYVIRKNNLIVLQPDKMPIGIYPYEIPFTNHTGDIEENDTIYMFSDGYRDQIGGPNNTKLKTNPFQELLLKISELPVEQQMEKLNSTMDSWKNGQHQNDDILVIGFKVIWRKLT
jgi:ligand-binding sensor domain-containing protein/serine phosphatase RsbU (regulator of sigma subunit)